MTWKSREDKAPPPQFFADVIGFLRKAFPNAALSREAIAQLAPYLVAEWQSGQTARNAAKATCACDGKQITVSPAAQIQVSRRAVLPPLNATRGTTFGIDELRERREIGKLRAKAAVEDRHAEYQEDSLRQLQRERSVLFGAGKSTKAGRTEQKVQAAETAIKTHRAAAAPLRQEADQLAQERGFWIPPAAEVQATEEAAKKKIGKRPETRTDMPIKDAPRKKSAPKVLPAAESAPKAGGKKKCDLCTDAKPQVDELSALVDEFVDAAMKDEGK